MTKLRVVILLVLALIAIPAAHLVPTFAVAFWAVGIVLPILALVLIVRERRRIAHER
jgi:membrane protein implicated in regulation of membrane protease activity